jgi:hypothetical protein
MANEMIEYEDIDAIDITDAFWTLIYQTNQLTHDQLRETTPYNLVKYYIDMEVRYLFYIPEYDRMLEIDTIQELFDEVCRFYQTYLPNTEKTIELEKAMAIINSYIETEYELDDLLDRIEDLPFK